MAEQSEQERKKEGWRDSVSYPDLMTAKDEEGHTYVASYSLQQEMDGLKKALEENGRSNYITRQALKQTRWFIWAGALLALFAISFYSYIKWETLLMVAHRFLGV